MPRKRTKKERIFDCATERGWTHVRQPEWDELRRAFPDISVSTIRQSGVQIDAPWCGIRQHTLEELEDSLRKFSEVYAVEPGLQQFCRTQVIAAKDRAKWFAADTNLDETTRQRKAEMAEWMLVWLGDPAIFPGWVEIRVSLRPTPPNPEVI